MKVILNRVNVIPAKTRGMTNLALLFVLATVVLSLTGCGHRQRPPADSTGRTLSPVSDTVPKAPLAPDVDYVNVAQKAGLKFRWYHHGTGPWTILDAAGVGCAFLDYDNDGWMDIFLVGWPRCALFHNNHDGTFTDVTKKAGITREGKWGGVCVGDYDNDGYEDIYVSGFHCAMLLHNNRHGGFTDVTAKAGLSERQWGTCCAFFDADNDGKLDLLVGHYVQTGPPYPWYCTGATGVTAGCRPLAYPAQMPRLYHNNGDGTFTDVSKKAGLETGHGKDLGIQFFDYDNDGKTDFYLANDGIAGDLFHNLGGGRFQNVAVAAGCAFSMDGDAQGGMGVDCADYDRDGKQDLMVSNFQDETYSLYHNDGGSFSVVSESAGLGSTRNSVGFGAKFIDFNDDGWPDLVFANGHVFDTIHKADPRLYFRQPILLYRNEHGRFKLVPNPGPGFSKPIVGRGLAVGDLENNGSQDLLIVDIDGTPVLLHNIAARKNHWIGIRLIGVRSNRDGYGARVTVKYGGVQRFQDFTPAGSYQSSMDPRIHFGLGSAAAIKEVVVRWPSGIVTHSGPFEADRYITIRETRS